MAAVSPAPEVAEAPPVYEPTIVTVTFPDRLGGGVHATSSTQSCLPYPSLDLTQSQELLPSIDNVELRSYGLIGSVFHNPANNTTDWETETLFCLQRYVHFRGAFRRVSLLMALGTMVPAVDAAMKSQWLRFGLLAGIISPCYAGYVVFTYSKNFEKLSGTRWEMLIVAMLVLQCIAIDVSEWARSRLDYGFMVMHFSFIHNFTPLGVSTMHAVSTIPSLGLYLALKIVRYLYPDTVMDDVEDIVYSSTKELCIQTSLLTDVVIGMLVPSLLLIFQTLVTMRRGKSMRQEMLHQEKMKAQEKLLHRERKTSEDMLGSMLPRQIINSLKRNEAVEAQFFQNVTVIFIEVCGFGDLCAELEPERVMEVLNVIYKEFDRLSDLLHVYKVETVCQVYMAVVGAPEPVKNHADVAAHFGLACLEALSLLSDEIAEIRLKSNNRGSPIQCRVGLNSGKLRAGVVGLQSPRYKLVGDTVNTASRMESTCEPGRLQVSPSTFGELDKEIFITEDRGMITVKGKAPMRTAWINGYSQASMKVCCRVAIECQRMDPFNAEGQAMIMGSIESEMTAEPSTTVANSGKEVSFSDLSPPDEQGEANVGTEGPKWQKGLKSLGGHFPGLKDACKKAEAAGDFDSIQGAGPAHGVSSKSLNSSTSEGPQRDKKTGLRGCLQSASNQFLFISPAYKAPSFLRKLARDRLYYEDCTLELSMASARNLTLIWLLVISVISAVDFNLDLVNRDTEIYSYALIGRVVGNHIVGIGYLLFLASPELFRRHAQKLSIAMLVAQGAALLVSAMLIYNNESSIIALYGVYVCAYKVISIFQRLCICLAAVLGMLLIELLRCDLTSVKNESTTIIFLITFFGFIACGIRLDEFMAHVAHFEKRRLITAFEELQDTKASGTELLNSLLPTHVVSLVRLGVSPIAEHHEDVSIIFTDIKGFTAYSSNLSPAELMGFLNSMYSAFDEVILNWNLYKVEIIGDAYFISSGCPSESPPWKADQAAMRAVEVALALLRTMPQVCSDSRVQMRVGIHTGPVVAGVVGKKGPRFHLFGPTVVYAEKMESHGEAGRVHISDQTYQTLQEGSHEYDSEERLIPVEGWAEEQTTWFVNKSNDKEAGKLHRELIAQRHKTFRQIDDLQAQLNVAKAKTSTDGLEKSCSHLTKKNSGSTFGSTVF